MSSNGCGCQTGLLKYIRPPYSKEFFAACEYHDTLYDIGGDNRDRYLADVLLFKNMVKCTVREDYKPWKVWRMITTAFCCYVAVRIFGGNYFNYTK